MIISFGDGDVCGSNQPYNHTKEHLPLSGHLHMFPSAFRYGPRLGRMNLVLGRLRLRSLVSIILY
jgi:hypothetical protein